MLAYLSRLAVWKAPGRVLRSKASAPRGTASEEGGRETKGTKTATKTSFSFCRSFLLAGLRGEDLDL